MCFDYNFYFLNINMCDDDDNGCVSIELQYIVLILGEGERKSQRGFDVS